MKNPLVACMAILVLTAGPALAQTSSSSTSSSSGSSSNSGSANCKVVELKAGEKAPSGLSTSVTAGGGSVSATTSVPGGNSSTNVQAGSGSVSSSSTSDGRSTTVTDSNGNCTIYRNVEAGR